MPWPWAGLNDATASPTLTRRAGKCFTSVTWRRRLSACSLPVAALVLGMGGDISDGADGAVTVVQTGPPSAQDGHVGKGDDPVPYQVFQQGAPEDEEVVARVIGHPPDAIEGDDHLVGSCQDRTALLRFPRDPREPPLHPLVTCGLQRVHVSAVGHARTRGHIRRDVVGLDDDDPARVVGEHPRRHESRDTAADHARRVEEHRRVIERSDADEFLEERDDGLSHESCSCSGRWTWPRGGRSRPEPSRRHHGLAMYVTFSTVGGVVTHLDTHQDQTFYPQRSHSKSLVVHKIGLHGMLLSYIGVWPSWPTRRSRSAGCVRFRRRSGAMRTPPRSLWMRHSEPSPAMCRTLA